jgi:hypothetical protein
VSNFAYGATYRDQVVTVEPNYYRDSIKGEVRGYMRKMIVEEISAAIETDVQLVVHWPKKMNDPLFK